MTTRELTIANEVCSLLDVVVEVTIKIQGGVDTHISQTMFSMLEIKEIIGDTEHWIRAPDQAYDGGDVLKEKTSLDDLTSEALKVRDTLLSRLESKGRGEASMPLERICALLDPRRKDCSEEHLHNGSAALKADAIADVKNVAKTFVDLVVVPASPAEDGSGSSGGGSSGGGSGGGGSGGSGSGSGEPNQPPPKRQRPSTLEERRRHRLASSKASSSSRASSEGKSTVTRRSVIERELRMYVAEDPTPEEDDFSLLDFWLRRSKATTCAETGEVEAGLPYLALIARLYHAIDSTSCQAERNFSALALLIGTMRSSMLPHKVERMMFLRLNRLVIPEVKALHNAVEANKAAATQCKNKVVEVEAAAAGAPVTLTL